MNHIMPLGATLQRRVTKQPPPYKVPCPGIEGKGLFSKSNNPGVTLTHSCKVLKVNKDTVKKCKKINVPQCKFIANRVLSVDPSSILITTTQ